MERYNLIIGKKKETDGQTDIEAGRQINKLTDKEQERQKYKQKVQQKFERIKGSDRKREERNWDPYR